MDRSESGRGPSLPGLRAARAASPRQDGELRGADPAGRERAEAGRPESRALRHRPAQEPARPLLGPGRILDLTPRPAGDPHRPAGLLRGTTAGLRGRSWVLCLLRLNTTRPFRLPYFFSDPDKRMNPNDESIWGLRGGGETRSALPAPRASGEAAGELGARGLRAGLGRGAAGTPEEPSPERGRRAGVPEREGFPVPLALLRNNR